MGAVCLKKRCHAMGMGLSAVGHDVMLDNKMLNCTKYLKFSELPSSEEKHLIIVTSKVETITWVSS